MTLGRRSRALATCLALLVASWGRPAGAQPAVPAYPGATRARVGDTTILTTTDSPDRARTRLAALLRAAGWSEALDAATLNGGGPAGAGTLLSYQRDGRTADFWITRGIDRRSKPVTMMIILVGDPPPRAKPARNGNTKNKGGPVGRPAR